MCRLVVNPLILASVLPFAVRSGWKGIARRASPFPARQAPVLIRIGECREISSVHYPIAMAEDDATRFRKQAEECRELAVKALSSVDKDAWLRLAEEWLKLAVSTGEERRR